MHLSVFADSIFVKPVAVGEVYPADLNKFYLQVLSARAQDAMSVIDCIARPSQNMSEAGVILWQDGCPVAPFEGAYYDAVPANPLNFSVRAFRFSGSTSVYLQCAIQRCASTQCAQCGDGRRLTELAPEDVQRSTVKFTVSDQFNDFVLPLDETTCGTSTEAATSNSSTASTTASSASLPEQATSSSTSSELLATTTTSSTPSEPVYVVSGSFACNVPDPAAFTADPANLFAIRDLIALEANASPEYVVVTYELVRRLSTDDAANIVIHYEIHPASDWDMMQIESVIAVVEQVSMEEWNALLQSRLPELEVKSVTVPTLVIVDLGVAEEIESTGSVPDSSDGNSGTLLAGSVSAAVGGATMLVCCCAALLVWRLTRGRRQPESTEEASDNAQSGCGTGVEFSSELWQ